MKMSSLKFQVILVWNWSVVAFRLSANVRPVVPLACFLLTVTRVAKAFDLSKVTGSGNAGGISSSDKRGDQRCDR